MIAQPHVRLVWDLGGELSGGAVLRTESRISSTPTGPHASVDRVSIALMQMIRYQARTYNVFDDQAKDAAE